MNQFTITDGTVEYKHTKPQGENFDNKAPMVRLTYTVAEGSDPKEVTATVMAMAISVVEGALAANIIQPQPVADPVEAIVQEQKKGRKRAASPTPAPAADTGADAASMTSNAADMSDPTEGLAPSSVAAEIGPSPSPASVSDDALLGIEPLTMKGDVQPLAQRVSAHLRQRDGNIDKLRTEIKKCGAESLLEIPEAKWPEFMDAIRPLLAD